MESCRYLVITPARNEQAHLRATITSVAAQTISPTRWVIVDDGSSDETGRIADEAAQRYRWVSAVHRPDRGFRQPGGGVIEAFYHGYRLVESESWDYLVKLDGDLTFAPDYFEKCFHHFATDSTLGIGGGSVCVATNGKLQIESAGDPSFHVRGATKIYRRACWTAIGGLVRETGWDTLDLMKANMLGWKTRTFAELPLVHHRKTGDADGTWKNWYKNGRANYIVGYHPVFMFLKCLKRLAERPVVTASVALGAGFLSGYLQRAPRVNEMELVQYIRRQQINRLLLRESIWP